MMQVVTMMKDLLLDRSTFVMLSALVAIALLPSPSNAQFFGDEPNDNQDGGGGEGEDGGGNFFGMDGIGSNSTLDLFVRDRYRTLNGTVCDLCEEGDDCFLESRAFYIENGCRSRGENLNSIYGRLADSPNTVCRKDFINDGTRCDIPNELPVFDVTDASQCDARFPVDTCRDSIEMSVLEGWCIESSSPVGHFVVPLTTVLVYGDTDACRSGSGDFATSWYPTDESFCMTASVDDGSMTVHGSQMYYCDGIFFNSKQFVDQECLEPSPGPREFLDGVTDFCIDNPRGQERVIADCSMPSFFCKDLYSTDFGSEIVTQVPTTSPTQNPALLDLYIRERYGTADGEQCGFCEERDGCLLDDRSFYVEDQCRSRGESRNAVYNRVEGSPDVVCRQDFIEDDTRCDIPDQLPIFNITEVADCAARWNANECNRESIEMSLLEGWCIESDGPMEPFVMPMAHVTVYRNADACGNATGDFVTSWFPADQALCLESTVDDMVDGETTSVYGSEMFYCEGNVFRSQTFSDRQCSVPTSAPRAFLDGVAGDCSDESARGQGRVQVDCGAPSLYCKDLYSTDFGFQIMTPNQTPPPSPASSATPSPGNSTPPIDPPAAEPTTEPSPSPGSGAAGCFLGKYDVVFYFPLFILLISQFY